MSLASSTPSPTGVPAAAILDLDVIWNPKSMWVPFYKAIGLTENSAEWQRFETERAACSPAKVHRVNAKSSGIGGVPKNVRHGPESFVASLTEYGIFVVTVGELEGWLPGLGISRRIKSGWIVKMLTRLGG